MSMHDPHRLKEVWSQKSVPVVLRRDGKGEQVRVRLPYAEVNYAWLRDGRRLRPSWNASLTCWEVPKAWFNDLVNRSLRRWGRIYVIQPYQEQEICAPACMNASGHECQCSCMGANHGQGDDGGWFSTDDAFAARWGKRELACRLMISRAE
ncbi:MAG: hypothetical protein COB29_07910 [Sulfitobacter sp.]|nr:MAG: hypothetical protein COB29_07910 [Sulfitobacter sp.]